MKNINTYFNKFERGQVLIDFDICLEEMTGENFEDYYYTLYQEEYERLKELNSYNDSNGYVVIANLGLWNGRKLGYKVINSLTELSFNDCTTLYNYRGEMIIKDSHHDGINYYLIRKIKGNFDTFNVEEKFNKHIYENKYKLENLINYYTEKLNLTI